MLVINAREHRVRSRQARRYLLDTAGRILLEPGTAETTIFG
jgi:hypothetical protein